MGTLYCYCNKSKHTDIYTSHHSKHHENLILWCMCSWDIFSHLHSQAQAWLLWRAATHQSHGGKPVAAHCCISCQYQRTSTKLICLLQLGFCLFGLEALTRWLPKGKNRELKKIIKARKKTPIIVLFKVRWEERNEIRAENPGGEEKATQQYHSSISKWKLVSPVKSFCCINVWKNSQFPGKSQYNFLLLPLLSPHMFLNVLGCCCK